MKMQANPSFFFFLFNPGESAIIDTCAFFFCPMYHHVLCRDNKLI